MSYLSRPPPTCFAPPTARPLRYYLMLPRDEETVERYVRYPETLSEAERARIALLLRSDRTARHLAAFYRGFYGELDHVNERPADEDDPHSADGP